MPKGRGTPGNSLKYKERGEALLAERQRAEVADQRAEMADQRAAAAEAEIARLRKLYGL